MPDIAEGELSRLGRIANRLLIGPPKLPHGVSPHRLRSGRGLEFFELRSYVPGDPPRDIDWHATARSRRPLVRTYRDEAFSTAWLCIDRSSSMSLPDAAKWTRATEIVAALAYLLLYAGNRVGLLAFSDDLDLVSLPGRGRTAYARLLTRLGQCHVMRAGGASRLETCARFADRGVSMLVVSDFLAPDFLRSGLARLLHGGASVQALQILSPAELAIAALEHAVVRDVESGARRAVAATSAASARAAARLAELGRELETYCRSRGIPVTRCDTAATWRDVILMHLQSLQRFRV